MSGRGVVRVAAWVWTGVVFVLLWMPPPPPPEVVRWWVDDVVHFGLMAVFGALWSAAGVRGAWLWPLGAAVGAVTELGQDLLPWERHASLSDFASDLLGVSVAIGLWRWWEPRTRSRTRRGG